MTISRAHASRVQNAPATREAVCHHENQRHAPRTPIPRNEQNVDITTETISTISIGNSPVDAPRSGSQANPCWREVCVSATFPDGAPIQWLPDRRRFLNGLHGYFPVQGLDTRRNVKIGSLYPTSSAATTPAHQRRPPTDLLPRRLCRQVQLEERPHQSSVARPLARRTSEWLQRTVQSLAGTSCWESLFTSWRGPTGRPQGSAIPVTIALRRLDSERVPRSPARRRGNRGRW